VVLGRCGVGGDFLDFLIELGIWHRNNKSFLLYLDFLIDLMGGFQSTLARCAPYC
jgi:hypothetical protein